MKYKVIFENVTIFRSKTVEEAIAMALSIHQASNVEHLVGVFEDGTDVPVVSLRRA